LLPAAHRESAGVIRANLLLADGIAGRLREIDVADIDFL
jgi:hypothetical protein